MSTNLTPTQELCLEVLAARHRLGHYEWPFDTRLTPAIRSLADLGLVTFRSGIVERTVLVSLTAAGREQSLSATYKPETLVDVLVEAKVLDRIARQAQFGEVRDVYATAWRPTS